MNKPLKYILTITALTAALTLSARANFMQGVADGDKLYIDVAHHGAGTNDFEGFFGVNNSSGPHVRIQTMGNVTTGSGFANIKPVHGTALTQLTFTPEDGNLFSGFSFRGQLNDAAGGMVMVMVQDNQGNPAQMFMFMGLGSGNDFARQGVFATDGETIQSITLISDFKEVKQIELTLADPRGVPDGGTTVMLLGAALGSLGMARRFLKK
jgi:hypothetical protein